MSEQLAAESKAYMLIGADTIEQPGSPHEIWHNAFVVDPQLGGQTSYYSKQKLVPFGVERLTARAGRRKGQSGLRARRAAKSTRCFSCLARTP